MVTQHFIVQEITHIYVHIYIYIYERYLSLQYQLLLAQICKLMEFLLNFPTARCNLGLWWFLSNLV